MSLSLVAALTWPGRVIGAAGRLPWSLPEDLKRFKALTLGHPVIMGRKTWESLPFKLPGRTNLVISRQPSVGLSPKGEAPDRLCASLEAAVEAGAASEGGQELFVIGGAQAYEQALPLADRLCLTLLHHPFEGDALFPAFDLTAWDPVRVELCRRQAAPAFDYEFMDMERRRA